MNVALAGLAGYLIGGIPFSALAARLKGVDLRREGSGNLGATNAIRVLGPAVGVPVLLLDILKGFAAVVWIPRLFGVTETRWLLVAGIAAILGHVWPIYLGFRGGKGVATAAGVFLGLAPAATGVAMATFVVALLAGRMVSLASILAALALPIALATFGTDRPILIAGLVVTLLVLVRHRSNWKRILAGSESRIPLGRSGRR